MSRWIVPVVVTALIIAAAYVWNGRRPPPDAPPPERNPVVRPDPEKIEREIDHALRHYSRKELTRIDNLSISVEPILKALPGVEAVTVTGAKNPTKRSIHIVNYHTVDKDLYRIDMEQAHGRKLTEAEFDEMYRDLLLDVECVQIEQMGLIRCMRHHGLSAVFAEGLSEGDEKDYQERIAGLVGIQKKFDQMRGQLAEVRGIIKTAKEPTKAREVENEILKAMPGLKQPLLEAGAPTRLVVMGELERVLPMEDAKRHEEAKPVRGGKFVPDPEKVRLRCDAIVKNVLDRNNVGVIVLGGSHDLSEVLPKDAGL